MQKLYRDSKGRFVSRESRVEILKDGIKWLHYKNTHRVKYEDRPEWILISGDIWSRRAAYYFRQFRNRYGIYECF